jgi:hypothetical protein
MSTDKPVINMENTCITIGDTTYKTSGNIVFADHEEGAYYLAESTMLDNMDQAIQNGILVNGMQHVLKKIRG